jgi:hypothetical protein
MCFSPLHHVKHVCCAPWVLIELLPQHLGRRLADAGYTIIAARGHRLRGDHVESLLPRSEGRPAGPCWALPSCADCEENGPGPQFDPRGYLFLSIFRMDLNGFKLIQFDSKIHRKINWSQKIMKQILLSRC